MADRALVIDYDHRALQQFHSVAGAKEALRAIFKDRFPRSVADFGCGNASWLRAALECGAEEAVGVEGARVHSELMHVPEEMVRRADLNQPIDLGRRFDLVLCLETAEHLKPESSETIVDSLVRHSDLILFSAAAPGQAGPGHINCRWPAFWQKLFNQRGFACSDAVRWTIWNDSRIEPWYRQNLMMVTRDEALAGNEARIGSVFHPELVSAEAYLREDLDRIQGGALPLGWYAAMPTKAVAAKLGRTVQRRAGIGSRSVAVLHAELVNPDARLRESLRLIEGGALPLRWYLVTPGKALRSKLGRLLRRIG